MKKIEPLKMIIRRSEDQGIFHDSRADVRRLADAVNVLISKQNELIEAVNVLIDAQKKD